MAVARTIVILDQVQSAPPIYRVLLRADVPATRQSLGANAAYVSAFTPVSPDTDPDLTGLRSGAVVEKVESLQMVAGTTIGQIQTELVARQAAYQAAVTASTRYSRWGTYHNGSAWTAQSVD